MRQRFIYIIFLLALAPKSGIARQKADSLISRLARTPAGERAELMIAIGEHYKMRNLDSAIRWASRAVKQAEEVGNVHTLSRAYQLNGDVLSMHGDFVTGAAYFDRAIQSLDSVTDSLGRAQQLYALIYSGGWLTPLHTFDQKIAFGKASLRLYTALKKYERMAVVHYTLGFLYANKVTYKSDSTIQDDIKWLTAARYHNEQAELLFRRLGDTDGIASSLSSQGENLIALRQPEAAVMLLKRSIKLYQKTENIIGLALAHWSIALLYQQASDPPSALHSIRLAIDYMSHAAYEAQVFELYDLESSLYRDLGDFKRALESSQTARRLRDKNYSYQRNVHIAAIQDTYEHKLKNEKIRVLEGENKLRVEQLRSSTILYGSVLGLFSLTVAGLLIFLFQRGRMVRQLKRNEVLNASLQEALESQLNAAKLTAARAQMNPHFVFNSINAIQNLIHKENKTEAMNYLNDFSKLTRQTLEHSSKETITLFEEITFLTHYLELEVLRSGQQFYYEIVVDASIEDTGYERIPPMMLQPLVENSIRHGFVNLENKGLIRLTFAVTDDLLHCKIEDNGIGRTASAKFRKHDHQSFATENTDVRLELLQKKVELKAKYKLEIIDLYDLHGKARGTCVILYFPGQP